MVIEHSFITTRPVDEVLNGAAELLRLENFAATVRTADSLKARRGVQNPARAKSVRELPQVARIEFDRGRVTLAASITEFRQNTRELQRQLLMTLALALEGALTNRETSETVQARWAALNLRIEEFDRKRRFRRNLLIALLILLIIGIIALGICTGMNT